MIVEQHAKVDLLDVASTFRKRTVVLDSCSTGEFHKPTFFALARLALSSFAMKTPGGRAGINFGLVDATLPPQSLSSSSDTSDQQTAVVAVLLASNSFSCVTGSSKLHSRSSIPSDMPRARRISVTRSFRQHASTSRKVRLMTN